MPGIDAAVAARRLRVQRERAVEHVLHGKVARRERASAAVLYLRAWLDSFSTDPGTGGSDFDRRALGPGSEAMDVVCRAIRVVFVDNEDVELRDAVAIADEVMEFLEAEDHVPLRKVFEQHMRDTRVAAFKRKRAIDDVLQSGCSSAPLALRRAAASGALRLEARR